MFGYINLYNRARTEWLQLSGRVLVAIMFFGTLRQSLYFFVTTPLAIALLVGYKTKQAAGIYILLGNVPQ